MAVFLASPAGGAGGAAASAPETSDGLGAVRLLIEGSEMSATRAEALESKVRSDPRDLESRTLLLGYYDRRKSRADPEVRRARYRHVLWVVRNRPESEAAALPDMQVCGRDDDPETEKAVTEAWLGHVAGRSSDGAVLRNAASYFTRCDQEKAERILLQGMQTEPGNGDWPRRLAQLYLLGTCSEDRGARYVAGERAFAALKRAESLAPTPGHRRMLLEDLARAAYFSKQYLKAKEHVGELFEATASCDWNYGNVINLGHTLLGLMALEFRDVKAAKQHMQDSAHVATTPQLSSIGPNMALAASLLEAGEKDAVLAYFRQCEALWPLGRDRLAKWRTAVEAGAMPDFGASTCVR